MRPLPAERGVGLVLDTANLAAGPVATLHLPLRLRGGPHGSWVPEHLVQAP
ncbi:carotenoid oxygenase family protein [Streptomyces spongiae]|uniref:carotenoid oxygenase family protein n=1 Tax=Streptomyces spongiae TaxID=565072 RepID=UPI0018833D16|nr:carotenoid oxygenase family protein [Streptomyces spongiae]